jgi:hypothetical protein
MNQPPRNKDEYLHRFTLNQKMSGFGIKEAAAHAPCPFCAAPDFMVFKIINTENSMEKGGTCSECGRSAKAILQRTPAGIAFEIVQTGGDDPPEWLTPKMRRMQ